MKRILIAIFFSLLVVVTACIIKWDDLKKEEYNASDSNVIPPNILNTTPQTDTPTPTPTAIPTSLETDFEKALNDGKDNEAIFYFNNYFWGKVPKIRDERGQDTVCFSPLDDNQKVSFIKTYLQEREMYREMPDGVTYADGKCITEYYMDKEKGKICFILYIWSNASTDEISSVYCTTLYWDDSEKIGNLAYDYDQEQAITYESLYDTNGKEVASISYKYIQGIPYPFIMKYENTNIYNELIRNLYRGQKFWFYKEMAEFDESGKWLGYNGNIYGSRISDSHYTCFYDEEGNLEKIVKDIPEFDIEELEPGRSDDYYEEARRRNYSSGAALSYRDNGSLNSVYYWRIPGSTGDVGTILYDEEERMIYVKSYITHGSLYDFYLYEGDEKRPWACIYIDSAPGFYSAKNGIKYKYGDAVSAYLYQ